MYKIELNTSIPYNYSFYCPDSRIELNRNIKSAVVNELTPAIKRGIYGKTLISTEVITPKEVEKVDKQEEVVKATEEVAKVSEEIVFTEVQETANQKESSDEEVVVEEELKIKPLTKEAPRKRTRKQTQKK